jgi:CHASE2 domain-containing sensor protein
MRSSWDVGGETLKSVFAHETALPAGTVVPIDFSIDASSFSYVSFIDVMNGRVDPAALRGKTVFVGPTAIELGDRVTVPVYRALSGVVVQAFATQTVRDGMLRVLPQGFYAVGVALWALFCALPVPLMAAAPVKSRFSTFAASVHATALCTTSVPSLESSVVTSEEVSTT